jgi:hypothetical protein
MNFLMVLEAMFYHIWRGIVKNVVSRGMSFTAFYSRSRIKLHGKKLFESVIPGSAYSTFFMSRGIKHFGSVLLIAISARAKMCAKGIPLGYCHASVELRSAS